MKFQFVDGNYSINDRISDILEVPETEEVLKSHLSGLTDWEFILTAKNFKLAKIVSKYMMIMNTPHFAVEEGNEIVFADPGVNVNPTAEQLADIAITTARTTKRLLGWEPRVAMLSFSTKGSASHADVTKVTEALAIARNRELDLLLSCVEHIVHGKIGRIVSVKA